MSSQLLFQCKVVTNNNRNGLGVLKDDGRGLFHHCTVDTGLHEADVYNVNSHIRVLAEWTPVLREKYATALIIQISCYL